MSEASKVICVICGMHENTHIGRVKACFQGMGTSFKSQWIAEFEKGELEKARQRQSESASVQGGDDFGQQDPR